MRHRSRASPDGVPVHAQPARLRPRLPGGPAAGRRWARTRFGVLVVDSGSHRGGRRGAGRHRRRAPERPAHRAGPARRQPGAQRRGARGRRRLHRLYRRRRGSRARLGRTHHRRHPGGAAPAGGARRAHPAAVGGPAARPGGPPRCAGCCRSSKPRDAASTAAPTCRRRWSRTAPTSRVHVPALLAAGGFGTTVGRRGDILLSDEEVQLAWRLQDAGHSVRYDSRIVVQHRIQPVRLTPTWLLSRLYWQGRLDGASAAACWGIRARCGANCRAGCWWR